MPELPEVESIRRRLAAVLCGQTVTKVTLRRRDVVRGTAPRPKTTQAWADQLLAGQQLVQFNRHGKQLAIQGHRGSIVCIHLGMSGALLITRPGHKQARPRDHVHVHWTFDTGWTLAFRDPRRFGGIWCFNNIADLHGQRWSRLGPDALGITCAQLRNRLARTRRGIKAALLDQTLLAGLGNIYVDEALHRAGIHPLTRADSLDALRVRRLSRVLPSLLSRAIAAGGSTLRDHVNPEGQPGQFQLTHQVYGRPGMPCRQCNTPLLKSTIAGRTTITCPNCQPAPA